MWLPGQDLELLLAGLWKVGAGGLGWMGCVVTAGFGIGRVDCRAHWGLDPRSHVDWAVVGGVAWYRRFLEVIQ